MQTVPGAGAAAAAEGDSGVGGVFIHRLCGIQDWENIKWLLMNIVLINILNDFIAFASECQI